MYSTKKTGERNENEATKLIFSQTIFSALRKVRRSLLQSNNKVFLTVNALGYFAVIHVIAELLSYLTVVCTECHFESS